MIEDDEMYEEILNRSQRMKQFPQQIQEITISPWYFSSTKKNRKFQKPQSNRNLLKIFEDNDQVCLYRSVLHSENSPIFRQRHRRRQSVNDTQRNYQCLSSSPKNLTIILPRIPSTNKFNRLPIKRYKTDTQESIEKQLLTKQNKNKSDKSKRTLQPTSAETLKKSRRHSKLQFKDLNFMCLRKSLRKKQEIFIGIKQSNTKNAYNSSVLQSN